LDNARSSLFGFIGTATDETLLLTTRLRLARVQLAQGDTDRAESTISGIDPKALVAEYAELRGDIHYARGQRELALAAYMEAAETGADNPFLNMKINELATES
jgi:predicted negative regulator of RcsB-dependent stress response